MATTYGVTPSGFILKRLHDILTDLTAALSSVQDAETGEYLTVDLNDENDPLVQVVNAIADQLSLGWEQLQLTYDQFDPLKATGAALSGLVQLNGLIRQLDETDSELRSRQQYSTEITGRTTVEDIYANLMAVSGVTFARLYVNSTTTGPDERSIPSKCISAVVVGGEDADVATVLHRQCPLGIGYYGGTGGSSTTYTVTDSLGIDYDIVFCRPIEVPIYIEINYTIINFSIWPSNGEDLIKQAILDYTSKGAGALNITSGFDRNGYVPGEWIYASELYVPVNSVGGIRINSIFVADFAGPDQSEVEIAWNKVATFDTADIAFINATPT